MQGFVLLSSQPGHGLGNSCRRLASGLLLAAALGSPAAVVRAALPLDPTADFVRAELVAEQDGVVPGQTVALGLRLRHAPHWHTYWEMPGDAGLPTRIQWKLDPGYAAGSLQWPIPTLLRVGGLANYGYEGTVLLPVTVQVPVTAPLGGTAKLAAHVDWLVCNDLCIPGGADLSIDMPIRSATNVRPVPDAPAIAAARRLVPAPVSLGRGRAVRTGQRIALEFDAADVPSRALPHSLQFFPFEAGRIEAAADQILQLQGSHVRLELRAAAPPADDFKALRGVLVADAGPGANGWAGTIDLPLSAFASSQAAPTVSVGTGVASSAPARQTPVPGNAQTSASATVNSGPALAPTPLDADAQRPAAANALSLTVALAGAALGGLILNLMPCVFPVLSLKLIGLVRHRRETPSRIRLQGAAFALGVVLSFVGLAAMLIALRAAGSQIGWGFQLQSPLVIAGLIGLFFVIGLNLLGAFEFTLGSGMVNRAVDAVAGSAAASPERCAEPEGLSGSFATGVLVAVVAAPCTAPFMGAALGYAVTQSAPVALLVFAALGAGMAAPYFVLTMVPSWLERLPRPGAWMERLKQVMAFPMFLTCVWLFWVLGQQIDMDAVAGMLATLVGLGLWAWATGLVQRGAPRYRWLAGAAVLATGLTLTPLLRAALHPDAARRFSSLGSSAQTPPGSAVEWVRWTQDAQARALAQGSPVFVDFTAAWCITCQANKRLVLHDERVEAAFRAQGVVPLQADWTRRDDAISRELARLQRSGVPVYVFYDRKGAQHVLPEILSTQAVLDALAAV